MRNHVGLETIWINKLKLRKGEGLKLLLSCYAKDNHHRGAELAKD